MIFVRFQDLLRETMGLDAASVGTSAVERAVQARVQALRLDDPDAYWTQLQGSRAELQALIEAVVVPETWFFRDPQAFAAMARLALAEFAGGTLRLLSLPCSTGEEPYTMAMALIDAGLPPACFRIDAIDISGQSLDRAREGVYGRNSFRGAGLSFRERHFEAAGRGYRIGDAVRGSVHFAQGNLFDAAFAPAADSYDIIFCRNLLIYFDVETQYRAIGVLKRLLAPKGLLFVGHAETGLLSAHDFVSAKIPMAFAFRKAGARPQPVRPEPARPRPQRAPFVSQPRPAPPWPRGEKPAPPRIAEKPGIEALCELADKGLLTEAARGCEAWLRANGPSAEVLHLLGLISDAAGEPAAAILHYRKALYLDPDHQEAIGHLAMLLRKQGDAAGAKLLGDRLRRLGEKAGK